LQELNSKQQKHLDFLVADFNATKAEIARRSNLQRIVLAAYIVLIGVVFKQSASSNLSLFWICGLWIGGVLAQSFHQRERLEISKLGRVIKERIARTASNILEINLKDLLHSQTNGNFPELSKQTHPFDRLFHWSLFCFIPVLMTIFLFFERMSSLHQLIDFSISTPYVAFLTFLSGLVTFCLLVKYHFPIFAKDI
jgi:uncharacterized membrane protein YciS (DUF1049 family)